MIIKIRVDRPAAKLAALLTVAVVSILLGFVFVRNFYAGVLSSERARPGRTSLASGIAWLPDSAPVLAKLAAAEMQEEPRDLTSAEAYALRAIKMSPWDYRHRLLLARIKEAQGDRAAAEQYIREALALAPNYTDVRWRLANLLLREGKLANSVAEFRSAAALDVSLLPETLDLLWRVSGNNTAALQAATPVDAKARLVLAQFLLARSRNSEALSVFNGIERDELLENPETPKFIDALIKAGRLQDARKLWVALVAGNQPDNAGPGIWNGGFESDISPALSTFDWNIGRNEYVVPTMDANAAHSGARSLRLDFLGRDTTRVDGQLKQLIIVNPGARYRIECYVKSQGLVSPEGPRVAVTDARTSFEIASSEPIAEGSREWQRIAFEFNTPANMQTAFVTIRRIPRFSYDAPTRGSIWFDDFSLSEQAQK